MKKQVFFPVMIVIICLTLAACSNTVNVQQASDVLKGGKEAVNKDWHRVSVSQDREKEIYCTQDRKLVLVSDNTEKLIYDNYKSMTSNPYSIWDYDDYKIQWSEDSNYVYIIDSIYDFKNDKLIPIKDCVIFSWMGNEGIYLSEGKTYEISYDGGLQSEMAVGKKIKAVENGEVKVLGEQTDGRYYVLNGGFDTNKIFKTIGAYITIDTASLRYSEEQLQAKIEEELHSDRFKEFLGKDSDAELNAKATEAIDKIKELREFQELQNEINNMEKDYPVELEGRIKTLVDAINDDTYCIYNVSGKYFLKDIKHEEVKWQSEE